MWYILFNVNKAPMWLTLIFIISIDQIVKADDLFSDDESSDSDVEDSKVTNSNGM